MIKNDIAVSNLLFLFGGFAIGSDNIIVILFGAILGIMGIYRIRKVNEELEVSLIHE